MIGIREGLHYPVMRDGNGRMTPFVSSFYNILGLGNTVHIAHLGVAVKLHSLSQAVIAAGGGKIGNFLDACKGAYGKLTVKLIHHGDTLKLYKGTHLDPCRDLRHLVIAGKHFDSHGVREISDIKHQNRLFILDLPAVKMDDLTPDDHLTDLTDDILDGNRILLKITAVNHIGIVGTFHGTVKLTFLEIALFIISLWEAFPETGAFFFLLFGRSLLYRFVGRFRFFLFLR